jgi:hypothetical protein
MISEVIMLKYQQPNVLGYVTARCAAVLYEAGAPTLLSLHDALTTFRPGAVELRGDLNGYRQ